MFESLITHVSPSGTITCNFGLSCFTTGVSRVQVHLFLLPPLSPGLAFATPMTAIHIAIMAITAKIFFTCFFSLSSALVGLVHHTQFWVQSQGLGTSKGPVA